MRGPMIRGEDNTREWSFLTNVILKTRGLELEGEKALQTTNVVNGQKGIVLVLK
jgi:hypothetical protein